MPRTLLPGQVCQILIVDAVTGEAEVVFESGEVLVEAPNWSHDGRWLVVNGDGLLWRLRVDGGAAHNGGEAGDGVLEPVEMAGVPEINNDHCIAPDGSSIVVSAKDGHLYEVPFDGGSGRRITREHPDGRGYKNYLHGVSPDGSTLTVIVGARPTTTSPTTDWRTNVALVAVADGATTFVTDDAHPDDGAEFSPDGAWVWFNTERFTTEAGHAQLARIRPDGPDVSRILVSDTVDWFPHPSPDQSRLVYVAYGAGTLGHPENRDVVLRVMELDRGEPLPETARDLLPLFGGQGTINVAGWAPDSRRFAAAAYPLATRP